MPRSPHDLEPHDLLVFTPGSGPSAWHLEKRGETVRAPLQPRFRATNSFHVRDAAAAGLGIALLPRLIGDPLAANAGPRIVLEGWPAPELPVSAVFASARYLAPKVRAFIGMALESFEGGRDSKPPNRPAR